MNNSDKKLKALIKELFLDGPVTTKLHAEFDSLSVKVSEWHKNEGQQGLKRMKELYGFLTRYALDESPELNQEKMWTKLDKSGCPLVISQACQVLRENRGNTKLVSQILSAYQFHTWYQSQLTDREISDNIKTIISEGEPVKEELLVEFRAFLKEFSEMYSDTPTGKRMVSSISDLSKALKKNLGPLALSKKGPNGVYLTNYYKDYHVLKENGQMDGLLRLAEEQISAIGGGFSLLREGFDEEHSSFLNTIPRDEKDSWIPGKIGLLPESGGKIRLIAQSSYFHQRTLQPLHDSLMKMVSSFPNDCTFVQDRGVDLMKEWQTSFSIDFMASFDHSSCTDLFPVVVQESVLACLYGSRIAHSWRTVLQESTFHVRMPQSGKRKVVSYGRGQPMGVFSSWPAMALSHHMLVHFAVWKIKRGLPRKMFNKYAILGDDVVISDRRVAKHYLSIVNDLGMKVNMTKSHISDANQSKSTYKLVGEFAKRLVVDGQEVSPVPAKLLKQSLKDPKLVPLLWKYLARANLFPKMNKASRLLKAFWPTAEKAYLQLLICVSPEKGGLGYRTNVSKYVYRDGLPIAVELIVDAHRWLRGKQSSLPDRHRAKESTLLETNIHEGILNLSTNLISSTLSGLDQYSTPGLLQHSKLPNMTEFLDSIKLVSENNLNFLQKEIPYRLLVEEFLRDRVSGLQNESHARHLNQSPYGVEVQEIRQSSSIVEKMFKPRNTQQPLTEDFSWALTC